MNTANLLSSLVAALPWPLAGMTADPADHPARLGAPTCAAARGAHAFDSPDRDPRAFGKEAARS